MNKQSFEFLSKLITSISPSGYEDEAASVWLEEARTFAHDIRQDYHGNSDAVINPGGSPRIMLSGHYDEIGFLVTHVDDDGFLWIQPVGGWDPQIPQGHHVVIRGRKGHVPGVVGKCPIHLIKEDARNKVTKLDELWVDIGATSRKDALKKVDIGDPLVLAQGLQKLEGDFVAGRGFDNRAGAFVVLEAARMLAKLKPHAEVHAVATVQEEIGLRGARTAAFGVDPQVGIAVDVTFATDYPTMGESVKKFGKIKVGKGTVITRGPNVNPKLFDVLVDVAKKEKIPYQINVESRATGTDANAIQVTRGGVATALLSIPNRYMHSPCELVSLSDLDACAKLMAHTCARITEKTNFVPFGA
jgi:tetrahedral aminopeptidase